MNYLLRLSTFCLSLAAWLTPVSMAQAPASSAPATNPVAPEAVKVELPKGYRRVEVNGRVFICLPDDQKWVEASANRIRPSAGPATKPTDLLANLGTKRDLVVASVLKDLPTLKPSQIEKLIDESLVSTLKQAMTLKPVMVYIVSPAEHLKQAMRNGWTDRRVRYNRVDDSIELDRTVALTPAGSGEESAVAVLFRPGDTEDQRVSGLAIHIADTEAQVQQSIASRSTMSVLTQFADFIAREALGNLPRKDDQVWMVNGLSNVLAARYVSMIHGSPLLQFIEAMVISPPNTPVSAASLDLLHPVPLDSLKDEFVAPQIEARRRKAIAVIYVWLTEAGDAKLQTTITSVERHRPADGETLVSLIRDASGIDLSTQLKPR